MPGVVHAAPTDGAITVQVSRDFSGDGLYDAGTDQPQAGIEVMVSDAGGASVSGVTDASGEFVVPAGSSLAGGRYLVETSVPASLSHLRPAPASAAGGANAYRSATTFVDVSGGVAETVRVGVWNPSDYAPLNPDYALAIQPSITDSRSLVRASWEDRGNGNGGPSLRNTQNITTIATSDQTGSIFGVAWSRTGDRVFSAAYAKAMVQYGPAGPGGVYATDPNTGVPNATPYVTIPNAGTSVHQPRSANRDDPFYAAAGTESLGGIALSEDETRLYVVNLADKRLYEVDATGATGTIIGSTPIADPGCVGGAWRPGAVTVRDGEVYVGGVCDASASGDRSDLAVHVLKRSGGSFTNVMQQPLDFARGFAESGGTAVSRQWNVWRSTWSRTGLDGFSNPAATSFNVKYPTPLLTTLEFDTDGSLFLGFRDRHSDQIGRVMLEPDGGTALVSSISAGDLTKACLIGGAYQWEGTGACPNNATPANSGAQAAGVAEYFPGDWVSLSGGTTGTHQEIVQGGMAYAIRNGEVGANAMDATGLVGSGGIGFFDVDTGVGPGGAANSRAWLVTNYPESFGKGNGLGDLDLIGTAAPIQIGNRVWFDADKDGVQDADEIPLPGATVRLLDGNGDVVATTTTNAEGEYYFGGDGAEYQLELATDYTVRFDVSTADTSGLPGGPPASALSYSAPGAGSDSTLDSNPTPVSTPGWAEAPVTTPSEPGAVDHTIDAGVHLPASVSVGDYVWVDSDRDGIQDSGEPGIEGVVLVVTGPDGNPVTDVFGNPVGPVTTDGDGYYTFDNLPPLPAGEHYTVSIDRDDPSTVTALEPYVPTAPGQGGDRGQDSSTWTAESGDLTSDGDRDPTLDFGFVTPPVIPPVVDPKVQTQAAPRVQAKIRPDGSMIPVALRDRVSVSGVGSGATGVARLYGPVTSRSRSMCRPANLAGSVSFAVKGTTMMTPSIKVKRPGYYTWVVRITTASGKVATHGCGLAEETTLVKRPSYGQIAIETGRGPGLAPRMAVPAAQLAIPGAGVKATVRTAGVAGRSMRIPSAPGQAGWLFRSAQPGDRVGTTVIAAHVSDRHDNPLAFWNLKKARKGQIVTIRQAGEVYRYKVSVQKRFARSKGIPKHMFSTGGAPRLLLVSCTDRVSMPGGGFHYRSNLVVVAKLISK